MKTLKFSGLLGLFAFGLTLTVLNSCTTETIEEAENLQILKDQSTNGKTRPVTAMPSDPNGD